LKKIIIYSILILLITKIYYMKNINALVRNKLSKEAIKEIKEQKDEDSEELNNTNVAHNNITIIFKIFQEQKINKFYKL
jgi:uncharacterized membrane protein SpoIIM required for sporulation